MKIVIVGTGYVGLAVGVCFANMGHDVTCVDIDEEKIRLLKDKKIPIYEPGLEELLKQCFSRLTFTTNLASTVNDNEVFFIAVGTPEKADGSANLDATFATIESICRNSDRKKTIVLKSTVPIGTAERIKSKIPSWTKSQIDVVNNPEFLREGSALNDFLKPDRVVIGCSTDAAATTMKEIYKPFINDNCPIIIMNNASAEMTKYAANAFLAVKISFINELAALADIMGADINEVRRGFTSDSRINPAFFYPGVGFGGSCFPKDVKALSSVAHEYGTSMAVVDAADTVNDRQKVLLFSKAQKHYPTLKGLVFGIWGLSFKPNTDDVREAPALFLIEALVNAGATVKAYDPIAGENALKVSKVKFELVSSKEEAFSGVDGLMLVTEWNEFVTPDFHLLSSKMRQKVIFDGRNVFDPLKFKSAGFRYFSIGQEVIGRQ
tara:strand:+ start:72848 stop:74155 length:1308 start_codon:yes stop_codon:yes gene_type:complete